MSVVRALFIFYMLATISDCLLRKGFLGGSSLRRLSLPVVTGGGVTIGMIAALLGVGGSVMTVPCYGAMVMRCVNALVLLIRFPARRAMWCRDVCSYGLANYSCEWISRFYQPENFRYVGTNRLGRNSFSRRVIPAVPDIWHARIYVMLLFTVLLAMLFQ